MATLISLDPATEQAMDELVRRGCYASRDEVVRAGIARVFEDAHPLTDEERAGIARGLADVMAGRTYPAEAVYAELERRFGR